MKRPQTLSLSMPASSKLQYFTYYLMAAVLLLSTTLFTLPLKPVGAASSTTVTLDADDATTWLDGGGIGTNQDSYLNDGSWKNDQSAPYFSNYMPISSLGSFTVAEIANISFATKRLPVDATGYDYFINIYTSADGTNDDASWYGRRITIDPMYSNDYNNASRDWVVWNSNTAGNTPTVYDSNNSSPGWYDSGSYATAELSDLQNDTINWNDYDPSAPDEELDYQTEEVIGITVATGSSWNDSFAGLVDDFNISLNNGDSLQVDFEGIDVSQSRFVYSERYVRENNYTTDIAAQVEVPVAATEVSFEVGGETVTDGNEDDETKDNDIYKTGGAASDSQWWRLQKILSGGEYVVTGKFKVDGRWFPINDSATVYSINAPTASYVLPSESNHVFRASDNPVRVKVEDEFSQFNRMKVEIDGSIYNIYRADCDLREAGNYLLCDVDTSATWAGLSEGSYTATTTTYTQVNSRVENLVSREFTIDSTAPVVSRLEKVDPAGVATDSMTIEADATDGNSVQNVEFFVREVRSDGACAPTEPLAVPSITDSTASGDTYSATFDTSSLNGTFCVFALAEDTAMNHSNPQAHKFSVKIDNTAPFVTVDSLTTTDTSPELTGTLDDPDATLEVKIDGNIYPATNNGDGTWTLANNTISPALDVDEYDVEATATDTTGNTNTINYIDTVIVEAVIVIPPAPINDTNNSQNSLNNNVPTNTGTVSASVAALNSSDTGFNGRVLNTTSDEEPDEEANSEDQVATPDQIAQTDNPAQQEAQESDGCSEIFGICWYWWAIPVVALIIGWFALGSRREI